MKDKPKSPPLPVIFKMEGKGKDATPVAFFPTTPGTYDPYTCMLYAHVGQHGHARQSYAASLKPATPEQYAPLLRELESLGYDNLRPVRKFLRSHLDARRAALSAI